MRRSCLAAVASALIASLLAGCDRDPAGVTAPHPFSKRICHDIAVTYSDPNTIDASWSGGIKDFCVIRTDEGYHVFHITDPQTGWTSRQGELTFGHASSPDLRNWTTHSRIDLRTGSTGWSPSFTWAPHVIRNSADGLFYMFYTGVDWPAGAPPSQAVQKVGLARSSDLREWKRYDEEGEDGLILAGPNHENFPWSAYDTDDLELAWEYDCRDPFVFDRGAEYGLLRYVMLNSIRLHPDLAPPWASYMAIAFATSRDLIHWQWRGYFPVTADWVAESASIVQVGAVFYLFWTNRAPGPAVRVAYSTTGIFGDYVLANDGGWLFGAGNETLVEPAQLRYLAFDAAYVLHVKKNILLPEVPSPTVEIEIEEFMACDADLEDRYAH